MSRIHCKILKKGNQIFISDKGSKFGTLVLINQPYIIPEQKIPVEILSGKKLLNLKINNTFSIFNLFSCCKCKNNDNEFVFKNDDEEEDFDNTKINNILQGKNDSIADVVLNLETIIKCNGEN